MYTDFSFKAQQLKTYPETAQSSSFSRSMFEAHEGIKRKRLSLIDLPYEVLDNIASHVLGGRQLVYIARQPNDQRSANLRDEPPQSITLLLPLMATTKMLRDRAIATTRRERTFVANNDTFCDLPGAFRLANFTMIRKLVLQLFHSSWTSDKETWPGLMDTIRRYLPNLEHLEIWSQHETSRYLHRQLHYDDQYALISCENLDLFGLMKLAAFLRHPQLNRAILPANFRSTRDGVTQTVLVLDSRGDEPACGETFIINSSGSAWFKEKVIKGSLLDTTLIRRTKTSAMAVLPTSYFTLTQPSTNSKSELLPAEQPTSNPDPYQIVDDQAYVTSATLKKNGWLERSSDALIAYCDNLKATIANTDPASRPQSQQEVNTLSYIADINELVAENKALKKHTNELEENLNRANLKSSNLQKDLTRLEIDVETLREQLHWSEIEAWRSNREMRDAKKEQRAEKARRWQAKTRVRGLTGEEYFSDGLGLLYGNENEL